jgi:hypothetical protein
MNFVEGWGLLVVEGSILASLFLVILFMRRALRIISPQRGPMLSASPESPKLDIKKISQVLKDAESLSANLSRNLEEKREIVKQLMGSLDSRIHALHHLWAETEGKLATASLKAGAIDESAKMIEMALAGHGVPDIAKRLGISQEEVQLSLDLRKTTPH